MRGFLIFEHFVQKYGRLPTEFNSDYLEMLQMSKYRILAVPDLKPGKCANCGTSKEDGRQYVDFGLEVDWYGIVFICGLCLADIASAMGLFKALEEKLKEALAIQENLALLKKQGNDLEDIVLHTFEEVRSYFDGLHTISNGSSSSRSAGVDASSKSSKPGIDSTKSGTSQNTTDPVKSTSSRRSKDVPSLADLLKSD